MIDVGYMKALERQFEDVYKEIFSIARELRQISSQMDELRKEIFKPKKRISKTSVLVTADWIDDLQNDGEIKCTLINS